MKIHADFHENVQPCNFVYVAPPSPTEMSNRLIRECDVAHETDESIKVKVARFAQEQALAQGLDWISHRFVSAKENQILQEAPKYIIHDLYKFTPGPDL